MESRQKYKYLLKKIDFINKFLLLPKFNFCMKKSLFYLFLLASELVLGQQMLKVSGKVLEASTKQPLEYATITLQNVTEKKELSGGITDAKGNFLIEAPAGTYVLKIQFFSFKTYENSRFVLREDKNIGTISLEDDVAQIEGVEVVGKKTTVEMRLDKKVYNVGDDMTVKGGSITDVLDNVPSISVDSEGTISLRGSESVRVLINGKPSALSGMSSETLKQLPAEMIERVEVVTNPSARYEAEGTAGIINIVLKKGQGLGLTGSASTFVGVADTENYGASVNLNLRQKKFNFFNTTSYRYNNAKGRHVFEQESLNNSGVTQSFQNEYRDNWRLRRGWNTNFGVEYSLTDKISITNSIMYGENNNRNDSDVSIFNYNPYWVLVSDRLRENNQKNKQNNLQYSFNYDQAFNDEGHKLTIDYQYSNDNNDENGDIFDIQNERTSNLSKKNDHLVKADYVFPIDKNTQFEAGYQGRFGNSDTDYQVFDEIAGVFTLNTNYSNHFIYKENVNAFYTQFGKKFGKINTMLGLRLEDTDITIREVQTGESKKKYTSLFPSAFLGYEFSQNNQVSISYTRRLQRPSGRFINPFTSRTGNTNLFRGNPDLDPTYTNAFDLGYLTHLGKVTLNMSAYYNYSTQVFQFVIQESGEFVNIAGLNVPVMINTPANLANQTRFGAEFTTTYSPKANWRFTWNVNLFNEKTEGDFTYTNYLGNPVTQNLDATTTSWFTRLSAKILLPLSIDFQTTGMYTGPRKTAQSDIQGNFFLTAAFSKEILNKKGTLSLNINDVFNSRKMKSDTHTATVNSYSEMQWRPRQATLNFTYRFGSSTDNKKRQQRNRQQNEETSGGEEMMF